MMGENEISKLQEYIEECDNRIDDLEAEARALKSRREDSSNDLDRLTMEAKTGVSIRYWHDIAKMDVGVKYRFYYGHDYPVCSIHGIDECECEDNEAAFVAWNEGVEVMRVPRSELSLSHDVVVVLLHGVGKFLAGIESGGVIRLMTALRDEGSDYLRKFDSFNVLMNSLAMVSGHVQIPQQEVLLAIADLIEEVLDEVDESGLDRID